MNDGDNRDIKISGKSDLMGSLVNKFKKIVKSDSDAFDDI